MITTINEYRNLIIENKYDAPILPKIGSKVIFSYALFGENDIESRTATIIFDTGEQITLVGEYDEYKEIFQNIVIVNDDFNEFRLKNSDKTYPTLDQLIEDNIKLE